jgi:VIT1/CCC1 family predicted Fe2+/Mn2+ transporter
LGIKKHDQVSSMPLLRHRERHFTATDTVRDVVIGMSDGLTVPFALAAGLSGAVASSHLVVTAGLAEIAAGSIAMGLGGYLAAKSEAEHYDSEHHREHKEVIEIPEEEKKEVRLIFKDYGLSESDIEPILNAFAERPNDWVNFMMRFELGIEKPDPQRAYSSALTIALSYILGGLIPLAPYFVCNSSTSALLYSCLVTACALFIFGFVKGAFTGQKPLKSALQTLSIGSLAALAAYFLAKSIS